MSTRVVVLLAAALSPILVAGCGGGSSGTKLAPGSLQVLLQDGDVLPGGFTIGTIEEARMAGDGSTSLIVSEPLPGTARGLFLRSSGGDVTPILTPDGPATTADLSTLRGLTMTQAGELDVKTGQGLDTDALFLYSGGRLSIAAQAGQTPPGFRLLGEDEIASGGEIAFTSGVSPCTVDTTTGEERIRCDLEIYRGGATSIARVVVPNDLMDQQATAVSLVLGQSGALVMGLPARGTEAVLAQSTAAGVTTLIRRGESFPGIGVLSSVRPRAVAADDDVLFDARVDENGDGRVDGARVFLRDSASGALTTVGRTGEPAGDTDVTAVRGLGIDLDGRAYYSASFADPGQETRTSLRYWEAGRTLEIAYEGEDLGEEDDQGNSLQILEIDQGRVVPNGDVLFRATAGFFEEDTRRIVDTRIVQHRAGSNALLTLIKTGMKAPDGSRIVALSIADANDAGDLLAIGSLNRAAFRALLFFPRS